MARNRPVFSKKFYESYERCDPQTRLMLDKSIEKILAEPGLGKPLKYRLAGTRSERLGSFRIVYRHMGDMVIFHEFEHRKKVYR